LQVRLLFDNDLADRPNERKNKKCRLPRGGTSARLSAY